MRKIKKKELYGKVSNASAFCFGVSALTFAGSVSILDQTEIPLIASTAFASLSIFLTYYFQHKSSFYDLQERLKTDEQLKQEETLKTMKYFVKEAEKLQKKGKSFFTKEQLEIINYALDDDIDGLNEYVISNVTGKKVNTKTLKRQGNIIEFPNR